jgi:6-phosphogluconolactonase
MSPYGSCSTGSLSTSPTKAEAEQGNKATRMINLWEMIHRFTDPDGLAVAVADWILQLVTGGAGVFSICLSGGSTPQRLYKLFACTPYRQRMPWERIHWFWGDERFVPWGHAESNYHMAQSAFLAHAPVPPENIHGIQTSGTPTQAAQEYEQTLQKFYGSNVLDPARPLFDIQLLGLGQDGHTASLFPHSSALDEKERWVVAVTDGRPEPRVTLTFPTIESSRHAAFLVIGEDKAQIVQRVLEKDSSLPAARVRPVGELNWFLAV